VTEIVFDGLFPPVFMAMTCIVFVLPGVIPLNIAVFDVKEVG
jgi:hypothetical protein